MNKKLPFRAANFAGRYATFVSCLALVAILLGASSDASADPPADSPAIVIVHGAWGGSHHWKPVAQAIRKVHRGDVRRASLTGLGERTHLASPDVDLETHIQDVVNLIEYDDLESVILIGHSYGGVVISGVAERIPEKIHRLVYLDAHLLDDGETFFAHDPERQRKLTDRANEDGDGYLIPVDWKNNVRDSPHPLKTLTSPIQIKSEKASEIPAAYWLFTDGEEAEGDSRYRYYLRAVDRGYDVQTFDWGHNPQRQNPVELAAKLTELLKLSGQR